MSGPTVYAAFGSKAGLLKVCIDVALAGDDEEAPVIARPLAKWVYAADDPRELVERYAVMMGVLAGRAGPIYDVLVRAADAEPELSALLVDLEGQRLRAATILASAIAERGGLPAGRTVTQARDTIWLLNAPELYVTVTARRGWSSKRYVAWARTALIRLVLDDGSTTRSPGRTSPARTLHPDRLPDRHARGFAASCRSPGPSPMVRSTVRCCRPPRGPPRNTEPAIGISRTSTS